MLQEISPEFPIAQKTPILRKDESILTCYHLNSQITRAICLGKCLSALLRYNGRILSQPTARRVRCEARGCIRYGLLCAPLISRLLSVPSVCNYLFPSLHFAYI